MLLIKNPKGQIPSIEKTELSVSHAQIAQNGKLWANAFKPMYADIAVNTPSKSGTIETIYRWARTPGGDTRGSITGATAANPVVISSVGHGLTNGQRVFITGITSGMTQINNRTFTVANKTDDTYELSGEDGTTHTAYTEGGTWIVENGFWFHFAGDVDIAKGPVALDTAEKTYFTDGILPKMTYSPIATSGGGTDYPNNDYDLGLPAPASAPVAAKAGASSCDASNQTDVAYVMTYVTELGEEGPPSAASSIVTGLCDTQQVDLSSLPTGPGTGNYNITHKRIYRTVTSNVGTQYKFLTEITLATTSYADTTAAEDLGEALQTEGWVQPPADMQGICFTANGIGAGFTGNTICLCQPNLPHAWPVDFQKYTDYDIVGIAPTANSFVVATVEEPYTLIGSHPSSMTLRKISVQQGCVAKRSVRSLGQAGVVYASADGLVVISASGQFNVITADLFSFEEWNDLNPSSMHGYVWDSRYYCFYTQEDGTQGGFYIDPKRISDGVVYLDFYATAGFLDKITGRLYLMVGAQIVELEGDEATLRTGTWRSKRFTLGRPDPMKYIRIIADDYDSLNVELHAYRRRGDAVMSLIHQVQVFDDRPVRLPSGYHARKFEIEINGSSTWTAIGMAESASELGAMPA